MDIRHLFNETQLILAFIQIIPIIVIWIRIENRLSRLEGRFDMFMNMIKTTISTNNDRP